MIKDKPVRALIDETARVLNKAVDHGLKSNIPPAEMVSKLKNDVFVFSACKTHIQLKEVSAMLVDDQGNINSFQKFSQGVSATYKLYDENYLQAEYGFATASAEMAAKWNQFEQDGDRYNLQYRTAKDDRVRETHAALADITLPVDDPFWGEYLPPNGWNCRCTTVQVNKGKYPESNSDASVRKGEKATTQIDSKGRNKGAMFRFNPGKDKVIFPPNHPYYKVQQSISSILTILKEAKDIPEFESVKSYKNGGKIEVHRLVDRKADDYQDVYTCCDVFAKEGKHTQICPKMDISDVNYESVFGELKGTIYWGKSPDFQVGKHFYELEGYKTTQPDEGTISHMLKRGAKQSSRIVIQDIPGTSNHFYRKKVYDKINQKNSKAVIDEVWVKGKKGLIQVYKKQ